MCHLQRLHITDFMEVDRICPSFVFSHIKSDKYKKNVKKAQQYLFFFRVFFF